MDGHAAGWVVELASGLLMLLDAHRITGRLPLDAQTQAARLRHAVKLAVQATAAASSTRPPALVPPDPARELRAWIAAQPWGAAGPGPGGLGVPAVLPRPDHG
jgi:hypothetical protein